MRRGEVLGLSWPDVDLDAARLSVHQAVPNIAYAKTVSDVKTATGRRTIDLDQRTVDVLRRWQQTQLTDAGLTGRTVQPDDLLNVTLDGDALGL